MSRLIEPPTRHDLLIALVTHLTFGAWCLQDLYVVPACRRCVMQINDHGIVHVEFADQAICANGFPLPDHPPDGTFKPVDWMVPDDEE